MNIDREHFWALVKRDLELHEWDSYEHQFYLSHAAEYAKLLDFPKLAPAWFALKVTRPLEVRAYVYNKKDGDVLVAALGGEVKKHNNWRDGDYYLWHSPPMELVPSASE